jgi:hypothetical protein
MGEVWSEWERCGQNGRNCKDEERVKRGCDQIGQGERGVVRISKRGVVKMSGRV